MLDFDKLDEVARTRRDEFASAKPFPHIVIDDFLPRETADRVVAEFGDTDAGWDCYYHYNERKMALTHASGMREHTQDMVSALQSRRFVAFIEQLAGLEGLVSDPDLDGAGLHRVLPGGFLHVHADFLAHTTHRNWSRQINLLVYLNRDWNPEWNGALELWNADMTRCVQSIEPVFNRCVMFRTDATSFHGHPGKLACPPGTDRKSLALYYFREENEAIDEPYALPRAADGSHDQEAADPNGSPPDPGLLLPEAVYGAFGRHREPHPQAILTGWPAAAAPARRVPGVPGVPIGRRELA
jgi:Rps23 Pro-64 3,4-dihydroxylase Tpa1-like proline 4-hydroxylase